MLLLALSLSQASNGSATEHVMWFGDFVHQTSACHAVTISTWEGKARRARTPFPHFKSHTSNPTQSPSALATTTSCA